MPKVSLPELMQDLKDGVITPAQYLSYTKTGKLGPRTDAPASPALPDALQTHAPIQTTAAPGLMGGPVLDAARDMTSAGWDQFIKAFPAFAHSTSKPQNVNPATLQSDPVRGVNDLVEGASKIAAPPAAVTLPGAAVSSPVALLSGLIGSTVGAKGGKKLAELFSNNPEVARMGENVGGAAGGFVGGINLAGKPPKLSPVLEKALAWQEKEAARKAAELELAKHQIDLNTQSRNVDRLNADLPKKLGDRTAADKYASDAERASKQAAATLKAEAQRVAIYDKGGYAEQQARYASDRHAASGSFDKAQQALDEVTRSIKSHEELMKDTELRLKKEDVADTRAEVDNLRNHNTLISSGRNADGSVMSAEQLADAPFDKAKNTIQSRLKARDAVDTNSGVNPIDTIHKPEVLKTLEDLQAKQMAASDHLETQRDLVHSLRQQQLDHAAKYKGQGGSPVDDKYYQAVEAKLSQADSMRAAARAAREAHLDHVDAIGQAKKSTLSMEDKADELKKSLLDLHPGDAPEVPLTLAEKLKKVASTQVVPAVGAGIGGYIGGGHGAVVGGALGEAVTVANQARLGSSVMRTAATIPPVTQPVPSMLQKLLAEKLGKSGGALQGGELAVPNILRQLLQGRDMQDAPEGAQ